MPDQEYDLDALVAEAVDLADGFYGDGPIDWEDLFDRLESYADVNLPDTWDHPIFEQIKRRVRKARREE